MFPNTFSDCSFKKNACFRTPYVSQYFLATELSKKRLLQKIIDAKHNDSGPVIFFSKKNQSCKKKSFWVYNFLSCQKKKNS